MQAAQAWKRLFSKKHLEEHYYERIETNPSIGMDKITPQQFKNELEENIEIVHRKVNNGTYNFTRYKQLLFTKGPNKPPRSVCVPTLRDKLTVSVLNELLSEVYGSACKTELPQLVIDEITKELPKYEYFIKLDIKTFYSSINQDILIKILKRKIRKPQIIDLYIKAIKTNAISYPVKEKVPITFRNRGVPEGLAISNALANIYFMDIDDKYRGDNNIGYWRYVDDILILTNENIFKKIKENINKDIEKIDLELNGKKDEGRIDKGFEYLGYRIEPKLVTVRKSSIFKMEQSMEDLFKEIKRNNVRYIEWKVNLKITGFILEEHKYGWLFFYSQITDLSLLFHLDDLVQKFVKRHKLAGKIKIKRFVRAYFEIRQALHETKYIPNIDNYSFEDKKTLLMDIYDMDLSGLSEEKIEINFRKIMAREIRDIEKDIQNIS